MAAVTGEQTDGLRALCLGDLETFKATSAAVGDGEMRPVWTRLLRTAFVLAVHGRFDESADFEIMKFVSEKRAISERISEAIEPEVAEALIRRVLKRGDRLEMDELERYKAQLGILMWILGDLKLRGEEMERFIAQARRVTDKHFAKLAEQEGSG